MGVFARQSPSLCTIAQLQDLIQNNAYFQTLGIGGANGAPFELDFDSLGENEGGFLQPDPLADHAGETADYQMSSIPVLVGWRVADQSKIAKLGQWDFQAQTILVGYNGSNEYGTIINVTRMNRPEWRPPTANINLKKFYMLGRWYLVELVAASV
jgi:alpha-tubulin suppressor-like RCC1 family protein